MAENREFSQEELDLLDLDMDEIEDLPGFEVPSNGLYLLKLGAALKTVNEKFAVELGYEVMECVKKDNEEDADAVPGTKFSQLFFLQGDEEKVKISLGVLKQTIKPIAEAVGEPNLKKLVQEHLKEILIQAEVTGRKDKENPEIRRPRISKVALV